METDTWEAEMAALMDAERGAHTLAPYKIFKHGDEYLVKNNADQVKARFKSRAKALKYLRALYANVKGAPGAANKRKWTGKQPLPRWARKEMEKQKKDKEKRDDKK